VFFVDSPRRVSSCRVVWPSLMLFVSADRGATTEDEPERAGRRPCRSCRIAHRLAVMGNDPHLEPLVRALASGDLAEARIAV